MRYHLGLAPGHVYTHDKTAGMEYAADSEIIPSTTGHVPDLELNEHAAEVAGSTMDPVTLHEGDSDVDQRELELYNREEDCDSALEDDEFELEAGEISDDEMFAAMNEMYPDSHSC